MSRETLVNALTVGLPDDQKDLVIKGAEILLDRIYTNFLLDLLNETSELRLNIREAIVLNQLSILDINGEEVRNADPNSAFVQDAFLDTQNAFITSLIEVIGLYGFADVTQADTIFANRLRRLFDV